MLQKLQRLPEPPPGPGLTKGDWTGALGLCLLSFLSTFPVVIPFLFLSDARLALRISYAVAIVMLFCCGYVFGIHSGLRPWAAGLAMVACWWCAGWRSRWLLEGKSTVRQQRRCIGSALCSGASFAALVGLWLAPMTGALAQARTPPRSPSGAIGLGNRGWSAADPDRETSAKEFEFSARAGVASDYIYRGTTLSDHGPAAGAAFETRFGSLYAGTTVATVKLPTQPAAEFTFAGGIRPKIATIDFDLGVTYFAYPGERLPGETNGINYWEAVIRGDRRIGEQVRIARWLRLFSQCLEYRRLKSICRGWRRL